MAKEGSGEERSGREKGETGKTEPPGDAERRESATMEREQDAPQPAGPNRSGEDLSLGV